VTEVVKRGNGEGDPTTSPFLRFSHSLFPNKHLRIVTTTYKNLLYHWLPLIGYCLLIFIQSAGPLPDLIPQRPLLDKLLHISAYFILGILFFRAYLTLPIKISHNALIFISISSSILYGISDEIHQHFVPLRQADFMDILADALGSVFGVLMYRLWGKKLGFKTV
jgi:VanZ family protein